jgi:uncharacterized protein HemX
MSDSESLSSGLSSKGDFSSSTEEASTSTTNVHRDVPEELAAQETRAVRHSRWLVIVVLIAAATGAGVFTFIFSQKEENDSFESQVSPQHPSQTFFNLSSAYHSHLLLNVHAVRRFCFRD